MGATHTLTGTIGGTSIAGYVRSSRRQESLCSPGQHLTLVLEPNWSGTANPAEICLLSEDGTSVIRGYVIKSTRARPSYDWQIEIDDDFTRLQNFFITDQLKATTIRSCSSWATQILNLCGVTSISFQGADANIPPGTEFGLRNAWEALQSIMAYASWYLHFDTSGTAVFSAVEAGAEDYTFSDDIIEFSQEVGDETTRNVIKVYGAGQVGLNGGRIFASVSRSLHGIVPDRIAAVGSPLIETQAEAGRVANYLLAELGRVTDYKLVTTSGNPSVRIGQKARIIHQSDGFFYNGVDVITSVEHSLDENGYIMDLKLGERCPRIAGWSQYAPPVYAGTSGSGVFRSTDGGINWTDFNTGLPGGNKYVRRLAVTYNDDLMAIVNGRLYYHNGTTWGSVTLTTPPNTANDSPAPQVSGLELVAVDAGGLQGDFWLIANNANGSGSDNPRARSWAYHTTDGGEHWEVVQLQTSGSGFQCVSYDLSSKFGTPYIAASSGSYINGIYVIDINRITVNSETPSISFVCFDWPLSNYIIGVSVHSVNVTGIAPNRQLEIYANVRYQGSTDSSFQSEAHVESGYGALAPRRYIYRQDTEGRTWTRVTDFGTSGIYKLATPLDEATFGSIISFRFDFRNNVAAGSGGAWQFVGEAYCSPSSLLLNCVVGSIDMDNF